MHQDWNMQNIVITDLMSRLRRRGPIVCDADFASTSPVEGSSTSCRPAELFGQLPE